MKRALAGFARRFTTRSTSRSPIRLRKQPRTPPVTTVSSEDDAPRTPPVTTVSSEEELASTSSWIATPASSATSTATPAETQTTHAETTTQTESDAPTTTHAETQTTTQKTSDTTQPCLVPMFRVVDATGAPVVDDVWNHPLFWARLVDARDYMRKHADDSSTEEVLVAMHDPVVHKLQSVNGYTNTDTLRDALGIGTRGTQTEILVDVDGTSVDHLPPDFEPPMLAFLGDDTSRPRVLGKPSTNVVVATNETDPVWTEDMHEVRSDGTHKF